MPYLCLSNRQLIFVDRGLQHILLFHINITCTLCKLNIDQIIIQWFFEFPEISACASDTCKNGGTCLPIQGHGTHCLCQGGFTGVSCNDPIDDCTKQPCANGGTCVDQVQGLSCTCPDAWGGRYCELGESESFSLWQTVKYRSYSDEL